MQKNFRHLKPEHTLDDAGRHGCQTPTLQQIMAWFKPHCGSATAIMRVPAAHLRRVQVLGSRVGGVHVQEVHLDALQRRVLHHAVLPSHIAGV